MIDPVHDLDGILGGQGGIVAGHLGGVQSGKRVDDGRLVAHFQAQAQRVLKPADGGVLFAQLQQGEAQMSQ